MGCSPSIWATMHALSPTAHTVHTGSLAGEGVEKKKKRRAGRGGEGRRSGDFSEGKKEPIPSKQRRAQKRRQRLPLKQSRRGKERKGMERKKKEKKKKKKEWIAKVPAGEGSLDLDSVWDSQRNETRGSRGSQYRKGGGGGGFEGTPRGGGRIFREGRLRPGASPPSAATGGKRGERKARGSFADYNCLILGGGERSGCRSRPDMHSNITDKARRRTVVVIVAVVPLPCEYRYIHTYTSLSLSLCFFLHAYVFSPARAHTSPPLSAPRD